LVPRLLKVDDLYAGYGKMQILNGVRLEAEQGRITVIVGPNGSGKSTLLKSISGIASVFQGIVELDGVSLRGKSPTEIARSGLAYLPQTDNVFTNLTVRENLRLAGYTVSEDDFPQRFKAALELFPQLSKYLGTKSSNLSGGERQMVAMAMAMMRKPTVVMFDEPTANLAPKIATQVLDTISSITRSMNLTTVLVEQNAKRALEMGDAAFLLVSGKTVFSGTCRELLEHEELGRLYLGLQRA
jgi:branched-chain amino acid transport system ATP-binding protein